MWILRIGVCGEFIGHGVFALQGKKEWSAWLVQLFGVSPESAGIALFLIGLSDIFVGTLVLVRPVHHLLLWGAVWGFATALVRPVVGLPIWDFVERWANWAAPLALYYWMKKQKD